MIMRQILNILSATFTLIKSLCCFIFKGLHFFAWYRDMCIGISLVPWHNVLHAEFISPSTGLWRTMKSIWSHITCIDNSDLSVKPVGRCPSTPEMTHWSVLRGVGVPKGSLVEPHPLTFMAQWWHFFWWLSKRLTASGEKIGVRGPKGGSRQPRCLKPFFGAL